MRSILLAQLALQLPTVFPLSSGWFWLQSVFAAALILATCTIEGNPELVTQSLPGFAPQNGQRTDFGSPSGMAVHLLA
jgi:hypothetical protein